MIIVEIIDVPGRGLVPVQVTHELSDEERERIADFLAELWRPNGVTQDG